MSIPWATINLSMWRRKLGVKILALRDGILIPNFLVILGIGSLSEGCAQPVSAERGCAQRGCTGSRLCSPMRELSRLCSPMRLGSARFGGDANRTELRTKVNRTEPDQNVEFTLLVQLTKLTAQLQLNCN